MKKLLITLFTSLILLFPLTAVASPDIDDVTMTMMDDDDPLSSGGTEIDIPGEHDDGPDHDANNDSSEASNDEDSRHDSEDADDVDDADDIDDIDEANEVDDVDDVDEPETGEDSENESNDAS